MATVSSVEAEGRSERGDFTGFIDQWIYVLMAALLAVTVLAGFIPDSFDKIAAIEAGERPPFSVYSHLHALSMGAWMLLLLSQSTLMATGNRNYHFQLGIAGFLLAPMMIISGILLVPQRHELLWDAWALAGPETKAQLEATIWRVNNIALIQLRAGILFGAFVAIALFVRKRDSGQHKRMLVLATLVPMGAALSRIPWLPQSFENGPVTNDIYALILASPLFLWDLHRHRRVHKAYLIAGIPWIAASALVYAVWNEPWWQELVPRLMGIAI